MDNQNLLLDSLTDAIFDNIGIHIETWGISCKCDCQYVQQCRNLTPLAAFVGLNPAVLMRFPPASDIIKYPDTKEPMLFYGKIPITQRYESAPAEYVKTPIPKSRYIRCARNSMLDFIIKKTGLVSLEKFKVRKTWTEYENVKVKDAVWKQAEQYLHDLVQNAPKNRNPYYLFYIFPRGGSVDDSGRTCLPTQCLILCGKEEFESIVSFSKSHPHQVHDLFRNLSGDFPTKKRIFDVVKVSPIGAFYRYDLTSEGKIVREELNAGIKPQIGVAFKPHPGTPDNAQKKKREL